MQRIVKNQVNAEKAKQAAIDLYRLEKVNFIIGARQNWLPAHWPQAALDKKNPGHATRQLSRVNRINQNTPDN